MIKFFINLLIILVLVTFGAVLFVISGSKGWRYAFYAMTAKETLDNDPFWTFDD